MRWLYLVVGVLVLSSIQFIAMQHLRVAPDLLLIFAIFLALNTRREVALTGAWLGGLFSEVSGGQAGHKHIGMLAFLFTFFAWVLVRQRARLFTEHWLTRTLIVGVVSLACALGGLVTISVETRQWVGWESWDEMLLGVVYTTIFSIPLIGLFAQIRRLYSAGRK